MTEKFTMTKGECIMKTTKTKETKKTKEAKPKREIRYEYFFSYVNRNNKFENLLADCEYLIESKELVQRACSDLHRVTQGNFHALINFKMLRKKYKAENED
jgi:hypothetical protein